MTTVLLIRHGQSVTNVTQVFTGHYDVPLSPWGRSRRAARQPICKRISGSMRYTPAT